MNYYEQMLEDIENTATAVVIQVYASGIPPEEAAIDLVTAITRGIRYGLSVLSEDED